MYKENTILGIIPARAGSKRVPKKNLLEIAGKPLISWTIDESLKSKYLDNVLLSTDCEEIALIAKKSGVQVPFLRPSELSSDDALTFDVIEHAVSYYKNILNKVYEYIVLLQPTSPLRESSDIDGAIEYLFNKKADGVISVAEMEHPIEWVNELPDNLSMTNFIRPEVKTKRSQDFRIQYRLNGAIYIWKTEKLLQEKSYFLKNNIYAYVMSKEKFIDIDTNFDFDIAEYLLNKKK